MDPRVLLRIAQVARRRPSRRRALVALGAVAVALGLAGIEAIGAWPDALTTDRAPRPPGLAARP